VTFHARQLPPGTIHTFNGASFALALASLAISCGPSAALPCVPFVAVREEQLRSERYPLPLTDEAKGQLLMYLAAGGDKAGIDDGNLITVVYADAEQRWGGLLAALADPANADAEDLSNGTYAKWLHGPPLHQVIDASVARPNNACPPSALTEERFTWIFECAATPGKLGRVFVQLALAAREEK
jgi:hypothetical protein